MEHDLFGKPASTFPDHALAFSRLNFIGFARFRQTKPHLRHLYEKRAGLFIIESTGHLEALLGEAPITVRTRHANFLPDAIATQKLSPQFLPASGATVPCVCARVIVAPDVVLRRKRVGNEVMSLQMRRELWRQRQLWQRRHARRICGSVNCGGAVFAARQVRSTPPVRLPTSATILAASASISASVMVLSRGCKVTAMAIDFLPSSSRRLCS